MATKKIASPTVIVRLSGIPVALRILGIQFLLIGSLFILSFLFVEGFTTANFILIFILLSIVIIDLFISLIFYFDWVNKSYEIRSQSIVEKRGIIFRREETYACSNIEEIILKQGILGRIFDFGSLRLYDPALQQSIYLTNIRDPHHYQTILRKLFMNKEVNVGSRVILGQGF